MTPDEQLTTLLNEAQKLDGTRVRVVISPEVPPRDGILVATPAMIARGVIGLKDMTHGQVRELNAKFVREIHAIP